MDDGISVGLSGKTLTVSATMLSNVKDQRSGIIELSFGNLKATIDIVQLEGGDLYLKLNPKSIPYFANTAGVAAPPIAVEGSGRLGSDYLSPGAGPSFLLRKLGPRL